MDCVNGATINLYKDANWLIVKIEKLNEGDGYNLKDSIFFSVNACLNLQAINYVEMKLVTITYIAVCFYARVSIGGTIIFFYVRSITIYRVGAYFVFDAVWRVLY